jgi:hypothetical protein
MIYEERFSHMDYDPSNEEHQQIMNYLIEEGAAFLDGIDEDGEAIYKFDMDVLEEIMPELHAVMEEDVNQVLVDLYQKGLIEVSYDENLNALMDISEQGKVALMEAGFNFDEKDEFEL